MVQPGGESTMLGQWRIILRQAEEAGRVGRFDEALALASRPEVAEFRQAVQLRHRLTGDLIARGSRRAEAQDFGGAIDDFDLADRFGASPDALAVARLTLADLVAEDVRIDLDAGEPGRVVERAERLAEHQIAGPALRRLREAADSWRKAQQDSRRGEFGLAREGLDRADRLAGGAAKPALEAARRELDERQKAAHPRIERFYETLHANQWPEILAAAESVLEILPDHSAARQTRARAWQQIASLSPSAALPRRQGTPGPAALALHEVDRSPPEDHSPASFQLKSGDNGFFIGPLSRQVTEGPMGRFLLWADGIGGYLVCLDDHIVLGRAAPDGSADIPLLGDLSRKHATLIRGGDGYVIQSHHPTYVNGRLVEQAPLRNGDIIRLGSSVEIEFQQPSPISSTGRLEILSRNRLPLAVDGVLLMGETCIVGPSAQAHIAAPNLDGSVVLYRQNGSLWCRAPGEFEVDGRAFTARAPLTPRSSVLGEGFSFSLEPLSSHGSGA